MGECVGECVSECMSQWVSEWVSECVSEWVSGCVSEGASDWVSEWTPAVCSWHVLLVRILWLCARLSHTQHSHSYSSYYKLGMGDIVSFV